MKSQLAFPLMAARAARGSLSSRTRLRVFARTPAASDALHFGRTAGTHGFAQHQGKAGPLLNWPHMAVRCGFG